MKTDQSQIIVVDTALCRSYITGVNISLYIALESKEFSISFNLGDLNFSYESGLTGLGSFNMSYQKIWYDLIKSFNKKSFFPRPYIKAKLSHPLAFYERKEKQPIHCGKIVPNQKTPHLVRFQSVRPSVQSGLKKR